MHIFIIIHFLFVIKKILIINYIPFNLDLYSVKLYNLLPTYIPFNLDLYNKFQENNITLNIILSRNIVDIWYCNDEIIYKLWKILKPVINSC